jgi:hypothetical protein
VRRERYKDSVNNLEEILKEQYSRAANVQNAREDIAYCTLKQEDSNKYVERVVGPSEDGTGAAYRGRSRCNLYGIVTKFNDDSQIETKFVMGVDIRDISITDKNDNIKTLQEIGISDIATTQDGDELASLTWRAEPRPEDGGKWADNSASNTIVIVRSPLTGELMTFIGHYNKQLTELLTPDNLKRNINLCVWSDDNFLGRTRAVNVRANGSNSSAVSIAPLDVAVDGVNPVECK